MMRTPFYQFHVDHGAKMVDFAGWQMPIMYQSIRDEHRMVRKSGGLFDVSHMARIKLSGRHARQLLERVLTRRVSDMPEGSCRYSLICHEQGGVLDDVIVYRFEYHWLVIANASNREKIVKHLQDQVGEQNVKIEDQTKSTAMVALQGPIVMDQLAKVSKQVPSLRRYSFCVKNFVLDKMTISRTGYTGEDGVEVILPSSMATMAIKLLLSQTSGNDSKTQSIQPAGLGSRDTLRLEAGMPLYGHELNEQTDPISAGLQFAVSLDKEPQEDGTPFIGQEALRKIDADGPKNRLMGLKLDGRRTARQDMKVHKGDQSIGHVTSGCLSPTLDTPIAMAYLDAQTAQEGDTVTVELGRQSVDAQVVPLPFYKSVKKEKV